VLRNSLIGSIILHMLLLIGVSFILPNSAVSKARKPPIYLELAEEPAEVNESVSITKNTKMQQSGGLPKRSGVLNSAKGVSLALAEVQAPLKKTAAVQAGKGITVTQPRRTTRPDGLIKTACSPAVDAKKPSAAGSGTEPRPSLLASPVQHGELVKTGSGAAVELKSPDTVPGSGLRAPLDASVAPGSGGSVKTASGPGGNLENPGTGSGSGHGSPIYAPRPLYPRQARRNNWEGAALLEVRIGPDGRVQKATVLQSSGYPLLDRAAEKAIKKWRYKPSPRKEVAVAWQTRVRVKFLLKDWED
jgi:protein TonB